MKCLCYSRCLLGPKYTLVFMSLLHALGCLSLVPLDCFLCSATIIVSITEAQECCTSEVTPESFFLFFFEGKVEYVVTYMMLLS